MDLFTYLMSKKGYNYLPHKDLFSYLLGKNNSNYKIAQGTDININSIKGKLYELLLTKESTQNTNLYDGNMSQGSLVLGEPNEASNRIRTSNYISVIPATSVPITFSGVDSYIAVYYANDKSFISQTSWASSETNIAVVNNAYYMKLLFKKNDDSNITPTSILNLQVGQIPNPDYPQDINVVTGYRNLFDKTDIDIADGWINNEGIPSGSTQYGQKCSGYIEIEPNVMYIMNYPNVNNTYAFYNENKQLLNGTNYMFSTSGKIMSSNANTKYIRFTFFNQNINNVTFFKGEENLPYVPYGTNWIYNKIIGKNLYSNTNLIEGRFEENGTITSTNTWRATYIKAKPNTQYTISGVQTANNAVYQCAFDENMNFINYVGKYNNYTFTTPANTEYLGISINGTERNTFQIEEGSTATSYEPYKEKYITLPLNDNEIAGIGTYKDVYIVDKNGHCYLNKKIGKVVLNGSEGWADRPNYTYSDRFVLNTTTIPKLTGVYGLCNYFKTMNNITDTFPYLILNNGQQITVNFTTKGTTTLAQFKTWLNTHNTLIYYPTLTENLIDLNYTVDMKIFKGANNITNSEEAYMVIKYL